MSESHPFQFGISSLLLITTLVAVVMSVSVMVPGIGICFAIVSVPALLRTYILVRRRRDANESATNSDKVVLFLLCLGIATLIGVAAGAAFYVTCLVGFLGGSAAAGGKMDSISVGLVVGGIVGACVALPLLVYLLRVWFRYPRSKPIADMPMAVTPTLPPSEDKL
jgi:hypothetical protein